ncbi:MAG: phosphotransferase [Sphingopyxis sp.]|uniref:phosphotransferase family protein n=1 Tax=Sphingopyxis sp. TaxID=1908224 RepID=UPI001A400B99|nr:phosphotransferase [Sphingopyxis sp.]MBL9069762.1 phosphotransferase [Sphingopyxis sp.]
MNQTMDLQAPSDAVDAIVAALLECRVAASEAGVRRVAPISGGVSCDVYRVDLTDRTVCVKRALPRLRVAAVWEAPVERAAFEVMWLRKAQASGLSVPEVLAWLPERNMFVMQWFDPPAHPVWKQQLLAGTIDTGFAAKVGTALAAIHNATAGDAAVAQDFASDDLFRQLRISPYLDATADAHPDLAGRIGAIAARLAETRIALVHGDVSPKNILHGPQGPVILDAECAWYGDPAFDAAFCLTHLLLKSLQRESSAMLAAFDALAGAWLGVAHWEDPITLSRRTAPLLAALLLARVDGKSPVEYLDDPARDFVRRFARGALASPVGDDVGLATLRRNWSQCMAA